MCSLALMIFGVFSLSRMGLELLPDLRFPLVTVVTVYPNADPHSVEEEVTRHIEGTLSTVAGLVHLESTSMENISVVVAEFGWGSPMAEIINQIQSNLDRIAFALPSDAERPIVLQIDPSQMPMMIIGFSSELPTEELSRLVHDAVRPAIEQIPGVAQVSVLGAAREQITVYYDSEALRENHLTPQMLQQIIWLQNVVVPAGPFVDDGVRYQTLAGNRLSSAEDVAGLALGPRRSFTTTTPGLGSLIPQLLHVRDVADVRNEVWRPEGHTRVNGQPALLLHVIKRAGANTVAVSNRVQEVLAELEADPSFPARIITVTDQALTITSSLRNVATSGLIGGLLAIAILYAFLRSWRNLLVICVAIPFSLLVTFLCLHLGGLTLNVMTLGGLALGVGLLVDNAIIVLENIHRLRREGLDPMRSAEEGASQIGPAVAAATLTTVVVFLPVVFTQSIAGHLFRELGITVSLAVGASLIVSMTLVPALASRLGGGRAASGGPERPSESALFDKFAQKYARSLRWSLKRPFLTGVVFIAISLSLVVLPGRLRTEFLPPSDGRLVTVSLELPAGTPMTRTEEVASRIEAHVSQLPEVMAVGSLIGDQGSSDTVDPLRATQAHTAQIVALLQPKHLRSRTAQEVAETIRGLVAHEEGDILVADDQTMESLGPRFVPGLTLEFRGPSLDRLNEFARRAAAELEAMGGFREIRSNAVESQPELFFKVNSGQALLAQLTAGQVGLALRNALTGIEATAIREDGRSIPIVLRPNPEEVQDRRALENMPILAQTSSAEPPPRVILERISQGIESSGAQTIHRVNRQRSVIVQARLDGIDLSEAERRGQAILSRLDMPWGYEARIAGIHSTLMDSFSDLALALLLAVALVYMVMAAQFESLRYPFVIMFTVPLASAGGLAALWAAGDSINVSSGIGLILLTGIAVNNGIVLIDRMNYMRARGLALHDAIVSAASVRLRPVLMTALTTILAMVPLALGFGEGSEIQRPLAIAVIGGMTLATALTLYIVPWGYRLLTRNPDVAGAASRAVDAQL